MSSDDLCRSFLDLWWHFDPAAATLAGIAEQDGRLAPWDAAGIREHAAALRSIAGAAEELEVEELADEIDRTALLDHLRVQLFRLDHERPHIRNPALWVEHAGLALSTLLERPPDSATAAAALARLGGLPGFFTAARETLVEPPLLLVETAVEQLDALAPLVEESRRRFAGAWISAGEDVTEVLGEAEAAVDRLRLFLRTEIAPHPEPSACAIGEEEIDRRLHHEHASSHNAAELWRYGNRLTGELEREVADAAARVEPGRPWRDVYEDLRHDGIISDDLVVEWDRAAAGSAEFARTAGLVDEELPPLAGAEAPAFATVLEPVAEYRPSGLAVSASARLSAPARVPDHSSADWLRAEHDRRRLEWLAARLGVPGRHFFDARRAGLARLVRREITSPSTTAGWSLYAGEVMAELGYAPDPASRLAERVLLLRDAHLAVADLGLHMKQLGPAECIEHLVAHLPIERRTAVADVRRLACRPLSACAAILGRRNLFRLRDDLRAVAGASFSIAGFHDAVLAFGGLPLPLIRWGMELDG